MCGYANVIWIVWLDSMVSLKLPICWQMVGFIQVTDSHMYANDSASQLDQ